MARAIPGSRLLIFDGAAHLSNLEARVAFDAAVREFLTTRL
jgi:pimeloyl-ACP methyl ester carboxylesterase